LQPRCETLSLRNSFDFQGDGVYGGFDPFESAVYGAKLTRRHWFGLQPASDETHDREAEDDYHKRGDHPGKHFVNYDGRIRGHSLAPQIKAHWSLRRGRRPVSLATATANELHVASCDMNLAETNGGFT
jgi:hypothetical protein